MKFKRKIWNENSSISYLDFNRIELAIELIVDEIDKPKDNDVDILQIKDLISDMLELHNHYSMSHSLQFTNKANFSSVESLKKILEELSLLISELKKEIKELKEKYEQK